MSPRKLTNDNKKEILKLYRETGETTSTLAERYGVSSSTISRFLKTHLTESEYEDLIQQKRLARTPKGALQLELEKIYKSEARPDDSIISLDDAQTQLESELEEWEEEGPEPEELEPEALETEELEPEALKPDALEKLHSQPLQEINSPSLEKEEVVKKLPVRVYKDTPKKEKISFASSELESLNDEEDDDDDDLARVDVAALAMLDDEDLLYFDEDEDEDDDWEDEDEADLNYPKTFPKTAKLQILPIASAAFPKTCYLVIDRAAELITRPLKEFAELGKIPAEEVQQKTLPVFDNHRVARRFSKRRERVIKIPDGRLIQKTSSYLEAKGITRLLLDGQIYSL